MKLSEIAKILNTKFQGIDHAVSSYSTDSRSIKPGQLFIALRGKQYDGHDYINDAIKAGAIGILVSQSVDSSIPVIRVEDTHQALLTLAQVHRQHNHGVVVAVTGSCGKTTVRALTAQILTLQGHTLFSEKSYNNDIGVPLTLLRLTPEHQFAVFELGANHAGEIARLTHLVHPHVAAITNAGPAHLEGFGSLEGVACAKGEIFQGLDEKGIAIINRDDVYYAFWKKLAGRHQIFSFGLNRDADFFATEFNNDHGRYRFNLHTPEGETTVALQLVGKHNVMNALTAAALAHAVGVKLATIKQGLEQCNPEQKRLNIVKGLRQAAIIDDSYNANPLSVAAAIDVLMHQPGEKILVLGDMLELGDSTEQWHRQLGVTALEKGIDRLFCLGPHSQHAADAFGKKAQSFNNREDLIAALKKLLNPDVTVLIKGSRGMRMEMVVNALSNQSKKE